jgi:hypothetical protein
MGIKNISFNKYDENKTFWDNKLIWKIELQWILS